MIRFRKSGFPLSGSNEIMISPLSNLLRLACIVILTLVTGQAVAESRIITGDEVRQLLTENTIIGKWGEQEYRQLFQKNGKTIYAPRKGQSTLGDWKINADTGHYESTWGSGWTSYKIAEEKGKYFWIDPGGLPPQSFEVLSGNQLVWPR